MGGGGGWLGCKQGAARVRRGAGNWQFGGAAALWALCGFDRPQDIYCESSLWFVILSKERKRQLQSKLRRSGGNSD